MTAIVVVLVALLVIFLLTRVSWIMSRRERRSINDYGETLDVLAKLSSQNNPNPPRTRRGPSSPEHPLESDDGGLEPLGPEQPRSLIGPLQLGNARRLRPLGRPSHAASSGATTSGASPFANPAGASAWARPRPHSSDADDASPDTETPVPVGSEDGGPDRRQDRPAMVFVDDSVLDQPSDEPSPTAGATPSAPSLEALERASQSPAPKSPPPSPADRPPQQPRPERPRWPAVETGAGDTVIRLGFGEEWSAPDADRRTARVTEDPGREAAAATGEAAARSGQDAEAPARRPAGTPSPEQPGEGDAGRGTDAPVVFIDDAEPWAARDAGGLSGPAGSDLRPPRSRPSDRRRPGPRPTGPRRPGMRRSDREAADLGGSAASRGSTGPARRRGPAHRRRAKAGLMAAWVGLRSRIVEITRTTAQLTRATAARVTPGWQGLKAHTKGATSAAAAKVSRSPGWEGLKARTKGATSAVAAKVSQAPGWEALSARAKGATRATAAIAVLAAAVVVAIVLALTLGGGGTPTRAGAAHRPLASPATTTTGGAPAGGPSTTVAPPVSLVTSNATDAVYRVPLSSYTLYLTSRPGPCWIQVRTGSPTGPVVLQGLIPANQVWDVPATGTLWVRVGFEANIQMSVNGMVVQGTSPTPSPYNFMFVSG